jgi:ABC-type microcin C transport system duplicated ATPase subunit YejF
VHTTEVLARSASSNQRLPGNFSEANLIQVQLFPLCQRIAIAIARAMAVRPKIVTFDELTSELNASLREKLRNLLRGLGGGLSPLRQ